MTNVSEPNGAIEQFRAAAADPEAADSEHVVELFRRGAAEDQTTAVEAMAAIATVDPGVVTEAIDDLVDHLDADDHNRRVTAARAIARIADHDPDAVVPHVDAVVAGLSSDDDILVEDLVITLDTLLVTHPDVADASMVEGLASHFESDLPTTRQLAASAFVSLAEQRPEAVLPAVDSLVQFLATTETNDIDEPVDVPAAPAIANEANQFEDSEGIREIIIRKWIADVLATVAAAEPEATADRLQPVVSELTSLLVDDDTDVRRTAVGVCSYVAEHHPEQLESVTERFIQLFNDDQPEIQAGAVWTLYYLEAEEALPALKDLQRQSSDEEVRAVVSKAIDHIES